MPGGTERYIIEIEGKERKSVTGKVRGRVQEHVKTMHRYPDATFILNRNEGLIDVIGVPRDVLEEALVAVQGELSPKFRFTFTIEAGPAEEVAEPSEPAQSPDERDKAFAISAEQAQKRFEEEKRAILKENERLSAELRRLTSEVQTLNQVRKRGEEVAEALKKEKEEFAALYENASSRPVQSPEEATRVWVGGWSGLAGRIDEAVVSAGLDRDEEGVSKLTDFTLADLHSEVTKILPTGVEVAGDIQAIVAFADVGPFEGTEEFRLSNEAYMEAKEQLEYLKAVESGTEAVPDFVKEMLGRNIDVKKNEAAMASFEELKRTHGERFGLASDVKRLLDRYRAAEALREVKPTMRKERPLPIAVFIDQADGHWCLDVVLPSVKGVVRETCMACVEKAASEVGLRDKDVKAVDNTTRVRYTLPKSVHDWKGASKKQEAFTWGLSSQLTACPLNVLGVKVRITKMMDLGAEAEKVELDLRSKFQAEKPATGPESPPAAPTPRMMIHGPGTGPETEPSHK